MTTSTKTSPLAFAVLLLILASGIFLRVHSYEKLKGTGFDEKLYREYVQDIGTRGWTHYPGLVERYLVEQKKAPIAFLPPTRVFFLLSASAWQRATGVEAIEAVRSVSNVSSIVLLIAGTLFAWRAGGRRFGLTVAVLLACAPLQLYISHRALIDGFFATVALFVVWTLWESLQNPTSRKWLTGYGCSLALMVLTKENAAFVYAAVVGILAMNRWLKIGQITKPLLLTTLIGPTVGTILLAVAAGGFEPLFTAYLLNVRMSYDLPYAIATGDGPWFRYLSDLMLTIPVVLVLAIGGAFQSAASNRATRFLLAFVVLSYLIMGNLRYGMNLRYALIWDVPFCFLASIPLLAIADSLKGLKNIGLTVMLLLVTYFQLNNYNALFVRNAVYDPVPQALNGALNMIK